jgi:hypothetical protein
MDLGKVGGVILVAIVLITFLILAKGIIGEKGGFIFSESPPLKIDKVYVPRPAVFTCKQIGETIYPTIYADILINESSSSDADEGYAKFVCNDHDCKITGINVVGEDYKGGYFNECPRRYTAKIKPPVGQTINYGYDTGFFKDYTNTLEVPTIYADRCKLVSVAFPNPIEMSYLSTLYIKVGTRNSDGYNEPMVKKFTLTDKATQIYYQIYANLPYAGQDIPLPNTKGVLGCENVNREPKIDAYTSTNPTDAGILERMLSVVGVVPAKDKEAFSTYANDQVAIATNSWRPNDAHVFIGEWSLIDDIGSQAVNRLGQYNGKDVYASIGLQKLLEVKKISLKSGQKIWITVGELARSNPPSICTSDEDCRTYDQRLSCGTGWKCTTAPPKCQMGVKPVEPSCVDKTLYDYDCSGNALPPKKVEACQKDCDIAKKAFDIITYTCKDFVASGCGDGIFDPNTENCNNCLVDAKLKYNCDGTDVGGNVNDCSLLDNDASVYKNSKKNGKDICESTCREGYKKTSSAVDAPCAKESSTPTFLWIILGGVALIIVFVGANMMLKKGNKGDGSSRTYAPQSSSNIESVEGG